MDENLGVRFGVNLRSARLKAKLSQIALSRQSGVNRIKILRIEAGSHTPTLEESICLCRALKQPLQWLVSGTLRAAVGLKGIALELYHLGVRDLAVEGEIVPGAFRRPEQVIALALRGDRPETRVIEAMPVVLANHPINPGLAVAFGDLYDRRVKVRLAWLCGVTLEISRMGRLTVAAEAVGGMEKIMKRVKKPDAVDDLGHPGNSRISPLWRKWNIKYAGTLVGFMARAQNLSGADPSGDES